MASDLRFATQIANCKSHQIAQFGALSLRALDNVLAFWRAFFEFRELGFGVRNLGGEISGNIWEDDSLETKSLRGSLEGTPRSLEVVTDILCFCKAFRTLFETFVRQLGPWGRRTLSRLLGFGRETPPPRSVKSNVLGLLGLAFCEAHEFRSSDHSKALLGGISRKRFWDRVAQSETISWSLQERHKFTGSDVALALVSRNETSFLKKEHAVP